MYINIKKNLIKCKEVYITVVIWTYCAIEDNFLENALKSAENDMYDDIDDENVSKQLNFENVDILKQTGKEKSKIEKSIKRVILLNLITKDQIFQMMDELNKDQRWR